MTIAATRLAEMRRLASPSTNARWLASMLTEALDEIDQYHALAVMLRGEIDQLRAVAVVVELSDIEAAGEPGSTLAEKVGPEEVTAVIRGGKKVR